MRTDTPTLTLHEAAAALDNARSEMREAYSPVKQLLLAPDNPDLVEIGAFDPAEARATIARLWTAHNRVVQAIGFAREHVRDDGPPFRHLQRPSMLSVVLIATDADCYLQELQVLIDNHSAERRTA